jgi:hypothetical protein
MVEIRARSVDRTRAALVAAEGSHRDCIRSFWVFCRKLWPAFQRPRRGKMQLLIVRACARTHARPDIREDNRRAYHQLHGSAWNNAWAREQICRLAALSYRRRHRTQSFCRSRPRSSRKCSNGDWSLSPGPWTIRFGLNGRSVRLRSVIPEQYRGREVKVRPGLEDRFRRGTDFHLPHGRTQAITTRWKMPREPSHLL